MFIPASSKLFDNLFIKFDKTLTVQEYQEND